MGAKRYVNRAKSGAMALPAQLRRRKSAVPRRQPRRPVHRVPTEDRVDAAAHEEQKFASAVAALAERGWYVGQDFVAPRLVEALAAEGEALWRRDAFAPAGIGRGDSRVIRPDRRGDWLHWLDPERPSLPQGEYLALMHRFRDRLNRELFLSLHELELQYAVYPPGQHYERHVDQFDAVRARLITVLLYLNRDWHVEDGGQLRIFATAAASEPAAEVLPERGTFVCFRSADIPHEVLPPGRERFSLGGWFRVRSEIPLPGTTPRGF